MKQTIRVNTFETNSSSTHSCILCSKEEYEQFKDGKLYVDWGKNFYKVEDVEAKYEALSEEEKENYDNDFDTYLYDNEYMTYDQWVGDYLERDETTIPPSNEERVMICKFGYNG